MTLSELNKKFNFHDSFIDSIHFEKIQNEVILKIELCNWMQKDYREGEPETSEVQFVFSGIKDCEGPTGDFDEMTILKTEYLPKNKFIFKLSDLNSHEYYELILVAEEVSFSVASSQK